MATTAAPVSRRALQARSIAEAFRITAEDFPDRVAVRTKDDEISLTWGELRERVDALAGGLAALGVQRGDTVALMLSNRPEFHLADLAVMSLGAVPFSIYLTSAPEQIAYVVQDAGSKVAIVEEAFLRVAARARALVIVLEGARGEGTLAWADVEGSNPGFDVESAWRAVGPEDLLTLIYTSGTTGPPKGVQLVHRNLLAAVESIERMIQFPDGAKVISWLPSAHIAERAAHHYLPIVYAMTITSLRRPARGPLLPAGGQADLVLRRAADLGEAQGGARGDAREPAARAARARRARARGGAGRRSSSSRPASRCRRSWRPPSPRPTPSCSPACARCSASTSSRRSTSAPRRRRARCWCSSTPSGSRSRSCGGCRRPAAPAAATRRARSASGPSGRPRRASRSSSPTTARC